LLNDKLSWAPFKQPPTKVLDVATGTGIWAIEFAQQHPYATVVGSDISMIQPEYKPSNCMFVQEDSEEPWIQPKDYFDYIHLRLVCGCFDHPKTVIQYAYESLAPDGWIEFHDTTARVMGADDTAIQKVWELSIKGAAAMGRDILTSQHYKKWLEEAGCT
jgi:ubiquinone/menaquinone biosynthesis C-methylase UbiE